MTHRVLLCMALAGSLSGCLGNNALRAKALRFNLTRAESPAAREALFLGMLVIPVYPICTLLDLLVFNTIEFWSRANPITGQSALADLPRSQIDKLGLDQIEVARVERLDDTRAKLHVELSNGDRVSFDVSRIGDVYTIARDGVELYRGHVQL